MCVDCQPDELTWLLQPDLPAGSSCLGGGPQWARRSPTESAAPSDSSAPVGQFSLLHLLNRL